MPEKLSEEDWKFLLRRIKAQKCTPFLGPGAYTELAPLSLRIAQDWSRHPEFPFADCNNLPLAAQFLSVLVDTTDPKDKFIEQFIDLECPGFENPDEPHLVLAALPFPIYITTNYDDLMIRALTRRDKTPKRELCRWNRYIQSDGPPLFSTDYVPSVPNPVVFHLYGYSHTDDGYRKTPVPESLVLTEDDYLDFLVNTSKDPSLIPPKIQKALTGTTLLLLGYRLDDWSFRVLFRSIVSYLSINPTDIHIAVQLVPVADEAPEDQKRKAQNYFDRYLSRNKMRVHWGKCQDFVADLRRRWRNAGHD
jgi:hypothetical protein